MRPAMLIPTLRPRQPHPAHLSQAVTSLAGAATVDARLTCALEDGVGVRDGRDLVADFAEVFVLHPTTGGELGYDLCLFHVPTV